MPGEQSGGAADRGPGRAARVVDATRVECGGAAVEAEPDLDAGVGETVEDGAGEESAVGLDGDRHTGAVRDGLAHRVGVRDDGLRSGQQRLAPVQIDPHGPHPVRLDVFGDAVGGLAHGALVGVVRTVAPAAVRAAVDVAVRAGEIAAAVHLQDELTEAVARHGPAPAKRGAGSGESP